MDSRLTPLGQLPARPAIPLPLGRGPVLPAGASSVDNLVCKGLLAAGCKASKATATGTQALLPHRPPHFPTPSRPAPAPGWMASFLIPTGLSGGLSGPPLLRVCREWVWTSTAEQGAQLLGGFPRGFFEHKAFTDRGTKPNANSNGEEDDVKTEGIGCQTLMSLSSGSLLTGSPPRCWMLL